MSADYDRLFHSGETVAEDTTSHPDHDPASGRSVPPPMPAGPLPAGNAPAPAFGNVAATTTVLNPVAAPVREADPNPPIRQAFGPAQNRRPSAMGAAKSANGARFELPRPAAQPVREATPVPAPSQGFAEPRPDGERARPQAVAAPVAQTSAATIGNHRTIDALSHVGVKSAVKMPSQRGWRHILYLLTRINLGPSPDEQYESDLHARIRRNARDSYQIGVFGLKGGVGKTALTVALGSALAKVRGDRILAIDADPDAGNLADRAGRQSAATVADLLADQELSRYNDIRAYTSMNGSNLEVLSSEEYSGARRAFSDEDWQGAVGIVSRYYNLIVADSGAGLFQPSSRSVLSTVSGMVIVASASIDGARQAAVTMDWMRQNGYQDLLSRSCVVINHVVPGKPNIDVADLVQQFERHLKPGRVVVLPWDKHIAAGTEIQLDLLGPTYRRRIIGLAAALSDDFDRLERR